jgi:hypothetical protein
MSLKLKPWPVDVVLLVCARPGEAFVQYMDTVEDGLCRDCGHAVVYSGRSHRAAEESPLTQGRPIAMICLRCFAGYDIDTADLVIDHRGGADDVYVKERG